MFIRFSLRSQFARIYISFEMVMLRDPNLMRDKVTSELLLQRALECKRTVGYEILWSFVTA